MQKIVFFHMNQLGDCLFSLPVLSAARAEYPNARIYSVARQQFSSLLKASGFVDEVIVRPSSGFKHKIDCIKKIRSEKFEKAVLFSESPEVLFMCYASGIPERTGFNTASLSFLLTEKAIRSGVPSLKNNFNLGIKLGLKNIPEDYSGLLKIPEHELDIARNWILNEGIDKSSIVIAAPGASKRRKEKCWQPDKWKKLLRTMQKNNLCPVLIGSPSEFNELVYLTKDINPGIKIFTAHEGILSLAALMKFAKIFVGIDSGAMHLAATLKIPVVALFGPTDPSQIGPHPIEAHTIIKNTKIDNINEEEVWTKILLKIS